MRKVEKEAVSETVVISFNENEMEPLPVNSEILEFHGLKILVCQQEVYKDGQLVPLTTREFRTLLFLARHPNWVFSAEQIYENVWQEVNENFGSAVATVISQLRHKLTPDTPKDGYIQTVTGSGYKFLIPK